MCIFAYGQTGSGKTHTMAGSNIEEYAGRGINYRALDDLFNINEERRGEVLSYTSIYDTSASSGRHLFLEGAVPSKCCNEDINSLEIMTDNTEH